MEDSAYHLGWVFTKTYIHSFVTGSVLKVRVVWQPWNRFNRCFWFALDFNKTISWEAITRKYAAKKALTKACWLSGKSKSGNPPKGQHGIGKPHAQTQLICRESAHQTGLTDTPLEEDKEMLKVISRYKVGWGWGGVQYGDYWRGKN